MLVMTVFYNGQFWVGVVEEVDEGKLKAAQVIFGSSEPSDALLYEFVCRKLLRVVFSMCEGIVYDEVAPRRRNPKRMARETARIVAAKGPSTKAQEAMKLAYEEKKRERIVTDKLRREACEDMRWRLRKQKHKEKQKGH